jgi:SET domain-containing protein
VYRPLPPCVTIKTSPIHGLGLYAAKKIEAGTSLGIAHVQDDRFENGYIRTPLGGFFNHSDAPNCKTIADGGFRFLVTLRAIEVGEELTAVYALYSL